MEKLGVWPSENNIPWPLWRRKLAFINNCINNIESDQSQQKFATRVFTVDNIKAKLILRKQKCIALITNNCKLPNSDHAFPSACRNVSYSCCIRMYRYKFSPRRSDNTTNKAIAVITVPWYKLKNNVAYCIILVLDYRCSLVHGLTCRFFKGAQTKVSWDELNPASQSKLGNILIKSAWFQIKVSIRWSIFTPSFSHKLDCFLARKNILIYKFRVWNEVYCT